MAGGKNLKRVENLPSVSTDVKRVLDTLEREGERDKGLYEKFCKFSEGLLGGITGDMDLTEETRDNLSWTGIRITPAEWWSGFLFLLLIPIVISLTILGLYLSLGAPFLSLWYLPVLGLGISALLSGSFYYYPVSASDMGKTEARSEAIETIMLLSFALHHNPDLRGAAVFAGSVSDGKLSRDIRKGLLELDQKGNYETVRQLFMVIARRWEEVDQGVRRAIFDILRSTGQEDESLRKQDVSKAPERVIDSAERELSSQLDSIIMPSMTFMIFGSLSIVGLIGLSPIFGMIGVDFIDVKFFALASVLLVSAFFSFTIIIESRRPVTLPPPSIPSDSPDLPPEGKVEIFGKTLSILIPTILVAGVLSVPGILYFLEYSSLSVFTALNTFWIIWGVAGGLSVYAYLKVGPRAEIREEVSEATDDWAMSLNVIGSRILDGCPMKRAIEEASSMFSGMRVGDTLSQATKTMDKFSVDPNYAFFETGIAEKIYSPLVASFVGIITRIRKNSEKSAGRAAMMAGDFLETLRKVERDFKEKISDATGNLWLMGVVLLPVVCALSVWILDFMGEISISSAEAAGSAGLANLPILTNPMESVEISILKLIMGLMVISLNLVVVRHISVLESGRDWIKFWSLVPKAVLSSTAVFTSAYFVFGLINVLGV